jgi:hypothetical protein
MRRGVRRGARIALVAIILVAGIAYLGRDGLRVCYHRLALYRVERGMVYQARPPRTLVQWIPASMAEPWTTPHLLMWEKFWHHEDALVKLGSLARHEFPFTNESLNASQLWTNAQRRFGSGVTMLRVLRPGQSISTNDQARYGSRATTQRVLTNDQGISWTAAVCTARVVQVTAPRGEGEKWRALVNEFDQIGRQSE